MLENLNDKQKEAVEKTEGPLLVLAGAGSGKTRVLTTRIAYLVKEKNISPYNILAITFTNKAAKEMKTRVVSMLGSIAHNIQISTFHSFGLLIIKQNYEKLGFKKNFTILDSDDTLTIIKKIMKEMNLDIKMYNPKAIRNKISSCKNELVDANDFEKYAMTDFDKIVHKIYEKYTAKLKSNNSLDFDDLLMFPIVLFKNNPKILQEYQEKYKYILIDEYQDTNEAQYILTKMISAKYKNICVVGDESQSIYSFRGSNYRNILNFEKDYNNPEIVLLEENYRSTGNILNAANDVIKNNKQRKDKNLWTKKDDGNKIKYHKAEDEKEEASYVVNTIEELVKNKEEYKDIAVLYRTNAQSRAMEEALLKSNIPYKVIGSFYFYNRKEIKDLIAYLKLIYNPYDDTSLLRIINVPKRGIGLKTISNIAVTASTKNISMYEAIDSGKESEFKKIIEKIKEQEENITITELIDLILDESGMRQDLKSEKSLEADIRLENLEEFKTITKNFEEQRGVVSLADFLEEISLVSDIEEHRNNDNVVTLMTIHSAKGLEFKNVFVIGLEESLFPHANSMYSEEDIEEERRLCYVALTRAKENLYLINARKRTIYGDISFNPTSRFIEEINDKYLDKDAILDNHFTPLSKQNLDSLDNIVYNIGDKIVHETYGKGVIVSIEKMIITVAFSHPHGIKKLIKGHKSFRKE